MNGFSAADMTSARAKGYQDRIEFEKDHIGDANKMVSAPVAAAPVVDVTTLRALSDRWANDRSYTGSPVDDIRALIEQPTTSTPAAPWIDIAPFRAAILKAQFSAGKDRRWSDHAELRELLALIDASPKGGTHSDDAAVDAFAAAMKAKLADARAKGRGGWNGDEPGMQQRLSDMLRDHVEKGDPRDVANFCMFLHQRGEGISPKGGSTDNVNRAAFQRWAVSQGLSVQRSDFHVGMAGDYVVRETVLAWEAWQASTQATSANGGSDAARLDSGMIRLAHRDEFGEQGHILYTGVDLRSAIDAAMQATSAEVGA